MPRPKISVLIPTYNNGQTLSQVIDDVLERLPSLIVVNDGSTDNTAVYQGCQRKSRHDNITSRYEA